MMNRHGSLLGRVEELTYCRWNTIFAKRIKNIVARCISKVRQISVGITQDVTKLLTHWTALDRWTTTADDHGVQNIESEKLSF